jgi:hypothetical protein
VHGKIKKTLPLFLLLLLLSAVCRCFWCCCCYLLSAAVPAAAAAAAAAGMVPLALVGRWGTPAPINSPMTVVFGKPIEVPHREHPTDAEVGPHCCCCWWCDVEYVFCVVQLMSS